MDLKYLNFCALYGKVLFWLYVRYAAQRESGDSRVLKLSKINRAGQFKYFIFYRELSLGGKIDQNETTSPFVNLFRRRR